MARDLVDCSFGDDFVLAGPRRRILILGMNYAPEPVGIALYTAGLARRLVQDGLLTLDHQRVASVVSTLESNYRAGTLGQQIDDLPLALVTPLGADYNDVLTHVILLFYPLLVAYPRLLYRHRPPSPVNTNQLLAAAKIPRPARLTGQRIDHLPTFDTQALHGLLQSRIRIPGRKNRIATGRRRARGGRKRDQALQV